MRPSILLSINPSLKWPYEFLQKSIIQCKRPQRTFAIFCSWQPRHLFSSFTRVKESVRRTSISFSQTFFPLSPCARLTDTPNIQEAAMNHGILAARTRYNRKHRTIKNCASCSRINHESIQPSSGLTAATVVTDRAQFAVSGTVATTIPSWCTHLTEKKNIYINLCVFILS